MLTKLKILNLANNFCKSFCDIHVELKAIIGNDYETALTLVENLESIDVVWNRLIESFGNPCLLQNMIASLENIGDLGHVSVDERVVHSLALLNNVIGELSK